MNIAERSLDKKLIVWVLTVLTVVVGIQSFFNLSWLEDPEFTIKDAVIVTPYPGASAQEVEEEVTNVIEMAVQELGQLKRVESHSYRGLSVIKATTKDQYDKHKLPQVWDELRRKVKEAQKDLPPGAGPSSVDDDFGGQLIRQEGKTIGYLAQEPELDEALTVRENIEQGLAHIRSLLDERTRTRMGRAAAAAATRYDEANYFRAVESIMRTAAERADGPIR